MSTPLTREQVEQAVKDIQKYPSQQPATLWATQELRDKAIVVILNSDAALRQQLAQVRRETLEAVIAKADELGEYEIMDWCLEQAQKE